MALHLFMSACFGVQKGETLVATKLLSYYYQSMRHVDRPKFELNTIIKCILNSVNMSIVVDSRKNVVAATDEICP